MFSIIIMIMAPATGASCALLRRNSQPAEGGGHARTAASTYADGSRQLDHSLVKRPRRDAGAAERRIGRWLGQRIRNSWPGTRNATLQKPIRR